MPDLTPYDTGQRLVPIVWPHRGIESRFGKVDFDNDESSTMLTAYVERNEDGSYTLHVYNFGSDLKVEVTGDD